MQYNESVTKTHAENDGNFGETLFMLKMSEDGIN